MNDSNGLPKELKRIENRLRASLQPVQPRADFVAQLRMQLDQEMLRKTATKKVGTGLLVAGGLVSLMVLVVTLIKTLATWPAVMDSLARKLPKIRKREEAASI